MKPQKLDPELFGNELDFISNEIQQEFNTIFLNDDDAIIRY